MASEIPPLSGEHSSELIYEGMTLRDWIAGMALAGILSGGVRSSVDDTVIARRAYALADDMLAVRAREKRGA